MAEKVLNTRIQLKYDTLARWEQSTLVLKAGELAVVTLGNMKDDSTFTPADQYPVLFKVGDNKHTFSQLPFASALAADVYAWGKAANVKLVGKEIQFQDAQGGKIHGVTLNYITSAEASDLIATALTAYSTTEQMNAAIKVETDRADAAEKALDKKIDDFIGRTGGFASQTDFAALKSKVEDEDGALDRANAAYQLAESKLASSDFETFKTQNTAAIGTAKSEAIVEAGKLVDALKNGDVKTNADAIAAINNSESGILAQAKADATEKANNAQSAAETTAKNYTDGEIDKIEAIIAKAVDGTTPVAKATDADKLGGIAAADYATKTYVNEADAATLKSAKDYADAVKKEILTGESETALKDTFDTLVEIQQWIEGDGVNATELTEAIAAEAKTRGEEDTKLQNQINALGIVDGKVASAAHADSASSLDATGVAQVKDIKVNEAGIADSAKSLEDSAKAEVKAIKVDNAAHADNADKLGGAAAADYLKKADAPGYADILTTTAAKAAYEPIGAEGRAKDYADSLAGNYATAAQGSKADSAVQSATFAGTAMTKTGTALSISQADARTALGLKSAAYTEASDYATAAQGGKADTALQEITTPANSGLKVSAKANNVQSIEFDDAITFIFNCGDSGVTA